MKKRAETKENTICVQICNKIAKNHTRKWDGGGSQRVSRWRTTTQ